MPRYHDAIHALIDTAHRQGHAHHRKDPAMTRITVANQSVI